MLEGLPIAPVEFLYHLSKALFVALSFGDVLAHGRFGAGTLDCGRGAFRQLFAQRDLRAGPASRSVLKHMQRGLEPSFLYERDRYVCPCLDGTIKREKRLVARIGFGVVDHTGLAVHQLVESRRTERLQRKPAGDVVQLVYMPLGAGNDMRGFVDL